LTGPADKTRQEKPSLPIRTGLDSKSDWLRENHCSLSHHQSSRKGVTKQRLPKLPELTERKKRNE